MIHDRIVVGLLDASLSTKLQLDPELTLEKATTATQQNKSVKKQQKWGTKAMTFKMPGGKGVN